MRPDARLPNLIHVGNRSTGVSCSPGTADRVLDLLRSDGLDGADRSDRVRTLPKVRRLLLDPEPETLPDVDPRYRQVVCVCEQVTAAEIASALSCTRRLRARSRAFESARGRPPGAARGRSAWRASPSSARCIRARLRLRSGTGPTARRSGSAVSGSRVAVVGAGIAGLAAAAELGARYRPTVLDRLPVVGGTLGYDAPAMPRAGAQLPEQGGSVAARHDGDALATAQAARRRP